MIFLLLYRRGKPHKSNKMIEVTGEVKFHDNKAPESLPPNSHLRVEFKDVSRMDAPSVTLGETEVDVTNYKKGEALMYSIKCQMPSPIAPDYSVSAVLNVGWKRDADSWIRKGDYLTDTHHSVPLQDGNNSYKVDVELVKY